jgi:hypothetical protein
MKSRYFRSIAICLSLVASGERLFATPPNAKLPVSSKVPVKPQRKIPDSYHGPAQTTKLSIYTQNGNATTRTTLGGEFPSQLSASANVAGPFALQWARDKGGKEQKTGVLTVSDSAGNVISGPTATMAAGSPATDVAFTFPVNAKPGTYNALVKGSDEISGKVTLKYIGAANTEVTVPTPGPMPVPAGPAYKIRLSGFKPMVGTSKKQADYKPAELSFEIQASDNTKIKELRFEVFSKPFTNSEVLTASGGSHAPIELLSGKWTFKTPVQAGKTGPNVVHLKMTSDYTKEGPGVSTPADWHIAYDKTDMATFKWTVDGQPGGSIEKPLHTIWNMPPWKEKDFQIPSPPTGPVKIPGKK